jgi:hypothetical protein
MVLMLFDEGSEYAVKKYVFGLNTTLLVLAAYTIAARVPKVAAAKLGVRAIPLACVATVPLVFAVLPQFKPNHATIGGTQLTNVERLLRHYSEVALQLQPGKSDYAVAIAGVTPVGDFLLSIVSLHAPSRHNAYAMLTGQPLPQPDAVRFIFTSSNAFAVGCSGLPPPCIPGCDCRTRGVLRVRSRRNRGAVNQAAVTLRHA